MKNIVYLLILPVFLSFSVSCSKKTTVKITAKNPVTEEPYPDLKFSVTRNSAISDFDGDVIKLVHSGYLNENGEIVFEIKKKKNRSYSLSVLPPENTCYQNEYKIAFISQFQTSENNYTFNYEFVPCAHLKLIINNVNCEGEGDSLILYQGNQINSFNFETPWLHKGCVYWETSGGYSNIPMGKQYYKWEVTRSGITEIFTDTIYIEAGEYRTYEINY